jgi:sulfotransferase family protein
VPTTSPVVIIGAPRSGTNMLRDALTALPGLATWPCDEINYVWRHGNLRHPSDEFPREFARPEVAAYVRRAFARLARRAGGARVVEKTCANSLRVGFVDAILPDARYLHIRRDPLDAVASALKRWRAPLDLRYVLRKARYVPPSDLPYYASRYLANRLRKLTAADGRLATWGPRFDGMDAMLASSTPAEVCAHQWRRCVASAERGLAALPAGRVCEVRYEDFVRSPAAGLERILASLGIDAGAAAVQAAVRDVRASEIGRGSRELTEDQLRVVRGIVGER